jgi:hypothetical protein
MTDFCGSRFGKLRVLSLSHRSRAGLHWLCQCECGNIKAVYAASLKSGRTKSCGCLHKKWLTKKNTSHGMSGSPEYRVWCGMRYRCYSPTNFDYPNYGGRGIRVCDRWLDFLNFLSDMGHRPSNTHSLDRIDGNGHYEPGNCRWATSKEQRNNIPSQMRAVGPYKTVSDAAKDTGLNPDTLYSRLNSGWPHDLALSTKARTINRRKDWWKK